MISRNLQLSKIKAFWFLFIKSPTFLPKTLDKSLKICGEADWIYFILSTGGQYLCYLLIVAVMLTTKTLLLLIFINIILIQMLLLVPPGISLSGFRISIYLLSILLWLINIQNSDQPHELLPACSVLTFFPLTLKWLACIPSFFLCIKTWFPWIFAYFFQDKIISSWILSF